MTILGRHTVAETRDLMRATEFRVNKNLEQHKKVLLARTGPQTDLQKTLDTDLVTFVRRWVDVRDKQTLIMTAAVFSNPSVHPAVLPAEAQFVAITDAIQRTNPRLGDIENRMGIEAAGLGLPPLDLSQIPAQDSPDADFLALKKLDVAIADGEKAASNLGTAAGKAAKSNIGLIIGAGALGVIGIVVATKVYL